MCVCKFVRVLLGPVKSISSGQAFSSAGVCAGAGGIGNGAGAASGGAVCNPGARVIRGDGVAAVLIAFVGVANWVA